jgi:hypothetical protein
MTTITRDHAILTALLDTTRDCFGGDNGDGFSVKYLENSGSLVVCYSTGNYNDVPQIDGIFAGIRSFANLTKLDSGEAISHTPEGEAFIAANADYLA